MLLEGVVLENALGVRDAVKPLIIAEGLTPSATFCCQVLCWLRHIST